MASFTDSYHGARHALRTFCPQALLNWREARFYGRYGEVELHLLEFLCRPEADALDVGANDGSYVHYLRRHAQHVVAFEPMPKLAAALNEKFPRGVTIEAIALSDRTGTIELRMPVVDGVAVEGCSTVSDSAAATYPGYRGIEVRMDKLDNVYRGEAGFIKIDVEGHEQAVLDGAVATVQRCRPRMLVEVDERLSRGGLARACAYFTDFGYVGYFVHDGFLKPVEQFSIERMQDPANLPDLTAPLQARQRFGRYVYNFIFLPQEDGKAVLPALTQKLASLRDANPPH
ncbi:methyltransferase, FkbM family [Enhydrobacter aerosaccus]|uniref:Methyltransferase, FkbM family n=1 Tax=Enhydrobacter aerosaccus TaxID=225324 RepID=A0A1T4JSS1_9HYPH|nr:FkbM family methyltransferase [Enhydrobacter aerosaccus]SJZ33208.1 methyltransferase, FkbM family [Enhydrobacter aerosaccus]